MHLHINHCFCTRSNHNDEDFYARYMVDINKLEYDDVDWDRLIVMGKALNQERLEWNQHMAEKCPEVYTESVIEEWAMVDCPALKPEIIEWLEENIKPQKDGEPGWAMGNDDYRSTVDYTLTLWFTRKNDARKFIREWSSFGKATSYFDYFACPVINLVLDTDTNKYRDRHQGD